MLKSTTFKLSFFMKSFNWLMSCCKTILICSLFSAFFFGSGQYLQSMGLPFLISIGNLMFYAGAITLGTASILLSMVIGITCVELYVFRKNESKTYFWDSLKQTLRLRIFFRQLPTNVAHHLEKESPMITDSVNINFNKYLRKSYVEIHETSIIVCLKVPKNYQTQTLLKRAVPQMEEEISSSNPDFFFSKTQRDKNYLWYIGKKRL